VAGRSKASWAARLLELWIRTPPEHGCLSVVTVVIFQVDVSASGWSFVQRSRTECSVYDCDREASIMRMPGPNGDCCTTKKHSS
jgi:hypothetical protein